MITVRDTELFSRGLLHIPNAFPAPQMDHLEAALEELCASFAEPPTGHLRSITTNAATPIFVTEKQDPRKICRIEYLVGASQAFRQFVSRTLGPSVSAAAGAPMVLFKDKCNMKHPGGGAFRPHQDITAYKHFEPTYHLTAAIPIDEATVANGCLEFPVEYRSAAGHFGALRQTPAGELPIFPAHLEGDQNNGDLVDEIIEALSWQQAPASRGDLTIFDSYIPHRSQENGSRQSRRMLFFTFNMAIEGDHYERYYRSKRDNPLDPRFHVSTPTIHVKRAFPT